MPHEHARNAADAMIIPVGAATAALNLIGVINGVLTMIVLILSAVYTIVRIRSMMKGKE